MGSLRGEDGDGRPPPDNGGLPDLPPEWGVVVVPDDLAELEREAADLRRESRRLARRNRWRRRFGLSPKASSDSPPVGIPLLIMCIAIVAALTSLFAITFTTRTGPDVSPSSPVAAPAATAQMVDLTLTGAGGKSVHLRQSLPAVILLLDGCSCAELIQQTAAAAPVKVKVFVVDKTVPYIPATIRATALADPNQALLAIYGSGADRATTPAAIPTALLIDHTGRVTASVSPASTVADFQTALTSLS